MIESLSHRIAANPWVYDRIQLLVGRAEVDRRVAHHLDGCAPSAIVLDIGGGTGACRALVLPTCTYICLDNDALKLHHFRSKFSDGIAFVSDATRTAIRDASVDVALCVAVAHHLPSVALANLIAESCRVLKPSGRLVFLDPVKEPTRLVGRALWKYDRGSFPRTADMLDQLLSSRFARVHSESFDVLHRYLLWIGVPRGGARI
jgi:ubiquinone/menaquinone biosynthesis C-methylase UbiE